MEVVEVGTVSLPEISVIMPVFNGSASVHHSIESVVSQSFRYWELLAIDDGSSDQSYDILTRYSQRDRRINAYRIDSNRGPAFARNLGLRLAKGSFVAYLDCDDEYYPNYLEQVARWKHKADVLVSCYDVIDEGAGVLSPGEIASWNPAEERAFLFQRNITSPLGVAHRADLLNKAGYFNESLFVLEDWDLWKRFALAGAEFIFVESKSGLYHIRPGSQSRTGRIPNAWYPRISTGMLPAPFIHQEPQNDTNKICSFSVFPSAFREDHN